MLHDLGYISTKDDPDILINSTVNPDESEYYEIVLYYVDNKSAISENLMKTIHGIKSVFKLTGHKAN